MTLADELNPCPFCGSKDVKAFVNTVECQSCEANGPDHYVGQITSPDHQSEAIAAWNRRAEFHQMPEDVAGMVDQLEAISDTDQEYGFHERAKLSQQAADLIESQQREIERLGMEAQSYRDMHEIATQDLGFPSILEALESVSYLRADLADATQRFQTIKDECLRKNATPPHIKRCAFVQSNDFLAKHGRLK